MPNNFMSYRDAYEDMIDNRKIVKQDPDNGDLESFESIINSQNNEDRTKAGLSQYDQTPVNDVFDSQSIVSNQQIQLRFTENISKQFMATLKQLNAIGMSMVRAVGVTKQRYEKFQKAFNKLKSLVDAAKNTRFH